MDGTLEATVLDRVPVGVFVLDRDGRILRVNEAAGRYCPWTLPDAVGRSFYDVLAECRDSETLSQSIRGAMEADSDPPEDLRAVLDHREGRVAARVRLFASDGQRFGVVLMDGVGTGATVGGMAGPDVARRIADIRHQINNPLMGIFGHAELLMIDRDVVEETRGRAEVIHTEARKIRDQTELLDRLRREISS